MLPCYALASGFLTGKYRPGGAAVESARAGAPAPTWTRAARPCWGARPSRRGPPDHRGRGRARLAARWPAGHRPIASARTTQQLEQILSAATLELTQAEVGRLSGAGSV